MMGKVFRQIGALWAGRTRADEMMFTGSVEIDGAILGIVIHVNKRKRPGSRQPDMVIYARETEASQVEDRINAETAQYPLWGRGSDV